MNKNDNQKRMEQLEAYVDFLEARMKQLEDHMEYLELRLDFLEDQLEMEQSQNAELPKNKTKTFLLIKRK
ncbi:hypothetical protein EDD68_101292 [Melghiribacillus thermohalophilus]|uniref:Uncharacterized protein n=1 Tax=Melghiribacillus thermohalophilus TaxID=1324956 RepID=A0A4R3NE56_9BACI|nr:hypothetical protein [Melghiribacillus thermohalophilus]TCT26935.1 hypothetical protein EDD68_101292 [Melghiribacillus thermohalophilus]